MRKVILNLAVSLDGLIEGPNGEYDWCFTDADYGMNEFLSSIDAILFGRKSYELVMQSFPAMWKEYKHYVVSNTLKNIDTKAVLINNNAEEKVSQLKNEQGKDIWLFGGTSLASCLLKAKLIDELFLAIHPIILGKGKPMIEGLYERCWLKLLETKNYDTGIVQVKYKVEYSNSTMPNDENK